jgi:hypothetical protein
MSYFLSTRVGYSAISCDDGCGDHLPGAAPAAHPPRPLRGDPHPAHPHLHGPRLQAGLAQSFFLFQILVGRHKRAGGAPEGFGFYWKIVHALDKIR